MDVGVLVVNVMIVVVVVMVMVDMVGSVMMYGGFGGEMLKVGCNDLCLCGSGKKYK